MFQKQKSRKTCALKKAVVTFMRVINNGLDTSYISELYHQLRKWIRVSQSRDYKYLLCSEMQRSELLQKFADMSEEHTVRLQG
jgi:hypothetical protein